MIENIMGSSDDDKLFQQMLKAMQQEKEGYGKNKKYWNIPSKEEGTFPIRILPPLHKTKGEELFYKVHEVSWLNGTPYESLNQTVYDPKGNLIHEAEKDPLDDFVRKLYKTSVRDSEDWKLAGSINSRKRYVTRVIVRNKANPETELQPQFYEFGSTIFNMLVNTMTTDYGIIVHPIKGRDYNIVKSGTGRKTKYESSIPSANITPIFGSVETPDVKKIITILEAANKMDYHTLFNFVSAQEKQEALNEHLGIATKTQIQVPETPIQIGTQVAQVAQTSEEVTEKNSEIDNLLNEFM